MARKPLRKLKIVRMVKETGNNLRLSAYMLYKKLSASKAFIKKHNKKIWKCKYKPNVIYP